MSTSHFADLTIGEIDHFRIRVRPLRRVLIKGIAAQPGVQTQPQAEVGEPAGIGERPDDGAPGDDGPEVGVPLDFAGVTLERAVEALRTTTGANIRFDDAALQAAGVEPAKLRQALVHLNMPASARLKRALDLLLDQSDSRATVVAAPGGMFVISARPVGERE